MAIAIQHHQAGQLQVAEEIYRQIVQVQPNYAPAWHLLGVIAHQVGKHGIAIEYIERAIQLNANEPDFHSNLAEAYCALSRIPEAIACYRQALKLSPDAAKILNNLGNALREQGKLDEAVACYRRALQRMPDYVLAHNNLGVVLGEMGNTDEAVACYRRTLELTPNFADALSNLGNALREQGNLEQAVACHRRALELKPNYAEVHHNLGLAFRDQGKLDEAVACYRRALELKPDHPKVLSSLGGALDNQGRPDEAVACYRRALELKPDFAAAHNNLGNALKHQGNLEEAAACYRRALELKPDYADAHLNQSLCSLLTGDFQRGWAEYRWRWDIKQCPRRDFSQALWDAQSLAGRTILLHAEQGLGDTIQFVRYAPLVKQAGAKVLVECQRPLVRLLTNCRGVDALIARGDDLPRFDLHAPLLSLPGIFHTSLETIPAAAAYLFADRESIKRWQGELRPIRAFKIGIAWRGSPTHPYDHARSIPLSRFEPLARLPGVHLVSLQKGAGAEELQETRDRFPMTEVGSRLDDFMDTAAVLANLDLVITCDSAVAHLAGSLGRPVWVALPFVPDWRWLLDRNDSPWYPTMRLFRQDRRGDWQGVFQRIEVALGQYQCLPAACSTMDRQVG